MHGLRTVFRLGSLLLILMSAGSYGQPPTSSAKTNMRSGDIVSPAHRTFTKGDGVLLSIYPDTALFVKGAYHIDDEGCVFLPIIGKVKIDTMSEKNLSEYLNTTYLQYLRYPNMQAQPLIRLSLLGGFQKPGFYYISPTASLWDAIALAGGTVREDGLKKIYWERKGMRQTSDLLPLIESGQSLETLGFQSGDQLWVTHAEKRGAWNVFTSDVLPLLTVAVTGVSAASTIYYASRGR